MKKSTKNLVSTKTENATGNGCSLTWMDIGITNAQFAVEEQKTMTAVRPVLTTAPTAVQRWMVMGMASCRNCIHSGFCYLTIWDEGTPCEFVDKRNLVEVVRCKDCKYQNKDGDCDIHDTWFTRKPDSFCCYGERKDND